MPPTAAAQSAPVPVAAADAAAPPPAQRENALPDRVARAIDTIVVHCSATPSGQWLSPGRREDPALVIDRWHAERGFKRGAAARLAFNPRLAHIGYHFVLDLDGQAYVGRSLEEQGAHVAGHNVGSIGLCLVGGKEPLAQYTAVQWQSLAVLVRMLVDRLPGVQRVLGHRDLSPDADGSGIVEPREWLKTCPGFDVRAWAFRGMAAPDGQVCALPSPTQESDHA